MPCLGGGWVLPTYRPLAKLYYTSFWDKFGINVNYFGMYPKTKKKFGMDPKLRPSQTPTNHPSQFFWHVPHSEPNWKTCVIYQSIRLRWKWQFISLYVVKLSWNDHDCLHNMFFGLISVCISRNNHKVVTKGSQTDPKVVTMQSPSKWSPSGNQVIPQLSPDGRQLTDWSPSGHPDIPTQPTSCHQMIPNWSQIDLKLVSKWPQNS